jgi:hypothetical protein
MIFVLTLNLLADDVGNSDRNRHNTRDVRFHPTCFDVNVGCITFVRHIDSDMSDHTV